MYLIGAQTCPEEADLKLTDVSSKSQMENNGWFFDIERHVLDKFKDTCGMHNTWYGFSHTGDGKITATFTGSGTATLDYGNCFTDSNFNGKVNVYLGGKLIDVANMNTPSRQITFDFSALEVLLLSETDVGIIKLNSLKLSCKGKTICIHKIAHTTNVYQFEN